MIAGFQKTNVAPQQAPTDRALATKLALLISEYGFANVLKTMRELLAQKYTAPGKNGHQNAYFFHNAAIGVREAVIQVENYDKSGTPKIIEKAANRKEPSPEQISVWRADGISEALDGCPVEPDGTCPHGSPSWLIELGLI